MAQLEFHQRAAEHLEEIMPLLDKEMGKLYFVYLLHHPCGLQVNVYPGKAGLPLHLMLELFPYTENIIW